MTLYLALKVKPSAKITSCNYPSFPHDAFHACQENVLMDDREMMDLIEMELSSWVETAPDDIASLILSDM